MSEIYRKRQVLKYINDNLGCTSKDVSKALNISVEDAQMFCFRLYSQGLVDRETTLAARSRKPCFAYKVSLEGEKRLAHWKTQEEKLKRKAKE